MFESQTINCWMLKNFSERYLSILSFIAKSIFVDGYIIHRLCKNPSIIKEWEIWIVDNWILYLIKDFFEWKIIKGGTAESSPLDSSGFKRIQEDSSGFKTMQTESGRVKWSHRKAREIVADLQETNEEMWNWYVFAFFAICFIIQNSL